MMEIGSEYPDGGNVSRLAHPSIAQVSATIDASAVNGVNASADTIFARLSANGMASMTLSSVLIARAF